MSLIVPAFETGNEVDAILDRGGWAARFGLGQQCAPFTLWQAGHRRRWPLRCRRDATSLELIRRAIDRGIPMLAICRGIQS